MTLLVATRISSPRRSGGRTCDGVSRPPWDAGQWPPCRGRTARVTCGSACSRESTADRGRMSSAPSMIRTGTGRVWQAATSWSSRQVRPSSALDRGAALVVDPASCCSSDCRSCMRSCCGRASSRRRCTRRCRQPCRTGPRGPGMISSPACSPGGPPWTGCWTTRYAPNRASRCIPASL